MRHEDIQRIYKNHFFTSLRNMGGAKKLTGNIDVMVFFVNDSQSTWTDRAKKQYRATQKAAMQLLLKTARSRGVNLQLRNAYIETTVSMNCTRENYDVWSKSIMMKYGKPTIPAFQSNYETANQCTEAPIIFVLNKPFRSCAVFVDAATQMLGEMSIISSEYTQHTIIHELLHQFGAVDLYYPKEVSNLIQKMNYASVMATTASMHIDSLTAYLIGWTDEIDAAATYILEKTKHFTRDYMIYAISHAHDNT